MRFRFLKRGIPFSRTDSDWKFAWFPKRMTNGTIIWMEWYKKYRRY